jgi:hypothetical protein
MSKGGNVEPLRVMGAKGYLYGRQHGRREAGRLICSPRALAEAAATHLESALLLTQFRFSPMQWVTAKDP